MAQQLLVGQDVLITEASRPQSFRQTTLCTIILDQWSARSVDPYLTTNNIHVTEISIPSVGFEHAIPANRRSQTYALDRTPKEIHAILTETLACFFPGRAKDLSAPMQSTRYTTIC